MKISKEQKKDLKAKIEKLNLLKIHLKKEFIGIDIIIDKLIHSISPFYLLPNSLSKPVVVNLWGMTGCGKTSLINEMVKFLSLESSYIKFDLAEAEYNNKLFNELSKKTKDLSPLNNIIVLDEFQTGRTINEKGEENNKSTLRVIWELMDSGLLQTSNLSNKKILYGISDFFKLLIKHGITTKDGVVISGKNEFNKQYSILLKKLRISNQTYGSMLDFTDDMRPDDYEKVILKVDNTEVSKGVRTFSPYALEDNESYDFVKPNLIRTVLYEILNEIIPEFSKKYNDIKIKEIKEIIEIVDKENDLISYTDNLDFSKSLIFCLGNLDECYTMAHDIEPDGDADAFYEHSLTITTPMIKNALSRRFRMEQISRLGNNHIIYPSINKKSYEKIIQLLLNKQKEELKKSFNINVEFDESINDILYKEGVYPTQGVRPVVSTFNMLIKSYIANIITDITLKMSSAKKIHWKFEQDRSVYIINVSNNKTSISLEYNVDCELERLRKSDNSEQQAMVAVHESGHALITCLKLNILPTEVLSKTANMSEGFCRYKPPLVQTKYFIYGQIMVCLAGRLAEELVFGKEMVSTGASSDLRKATTIAHNLVKKYGMHDTLTMISPIIDADMVYNYAKTEDYEKVVIDIVNKATEETRELLKLHKKELIDMSVYLSTNSKIEQNAIKEIFFGLNISWKDADSYYGFKDKLLEFRK